MIQIRFSICVALSLWLCGSSEGGTNTGREVMDCASRESVFCTIMEIAITSRPARPTHNIIAT